MDDPPSPHRRVGDAMMNPIPITIRGVQYRSIVEAARAHGVNPSTISHALNNGTLDNVGMGRSRPKPFEYNKTLYSSQAECARAFGIRTNAFNKRLDKGRDPVTGERLTHTPPQTRP